MTKVHISRPKGALGYQYQVVEGAKCWSCGNTDRHTMESGFLICGKCRFCHSYYQTQEALGKTPSTHGQKGGS